MAEDLVILGAGGSAADIAEAVESVGSAGSRWRLRGFLDDDPEKQGRAVAGYPVLGPLELARALPDTSFLVGTAHYRRPLTRKHVVERLALPPERYATLVHESASISPGARVGIGTLVLQSTVVSHGATIGNHVFIGPQCVVSHDAVVEDFATLAVGATLCGGARLEPGAYAGARSVIRDGVVVGPGTVVGLGSAVFRNLGPGVVAVGNPARVVPGSRRSES